MIFIMQLLKNKILFLLIMAGSFASAAQEPARFISVPGGHYRIGKAHHLLNPLRTVTVNSFRIAVHETTNREFAAFVAATGYITTAEKKHNALVYKPGLPEFRWATDSTACWRYPNGMSQGDIREKMNHPVTCISYQDALAYCAWSGTRLPSLEEWEIACRAGTDTGYYFGEPYDSIARYANIWHGSDHLQPDSSDGYVFTAPVGSFAPNPRGLYDMLGNVFEFCSGKINAAQSPSVVHARGGSWWCSHHACHFFNAADIGRVNRYASFSNQGFRVVATVR